MASMQKRSFNFYKIFCPQTCSQKMEIPISYTESEKRLPRKVLLRNRLMKVWSIEITETGDGMFFQKGWAKFVEDNSFINGDHLVFTYDGRGVYDFFVFDSSDCEKIMVEGAQAQLKGLKENDGDDNTQDAFFLVEVDINIVNEVKKDEEMEAAEEDNDDGHHTRSKGKRSIAGGSKRDASAKKRDSSAKKKDVSAKKKDASAKKKDASAKKRDVPDHFGADLFKSGRYAQPTNPYFVTRLRPKRRDDLYIPIEVIRDNNIVLPPTVTLRDPRGKEWTAYVKVWGDGRTWLTGGWRSLCRWNLVEKEERCICEFVPSLGQGMVLQVTVVRE